MSSDFVKTSAVVGTGFFCRGLRAQIVKVAGSGQVVIQGAEHFFERQTDELTRVIVSFLGRALK